MSKKWLQISRTSEYDPSTANAAADSALAQLDDISSDAKIAPVEKINSKANVGCSCC